MLAIFFQSHLALLQSLLHLSGELLPAFMEFLYADYNKPHLFWWLPIAESVLPPALITKPIQLQKSKCIKWCINIFPVDCTYKKTPLLFCFLNKLAGLDSAQELYHMPSAGLSSRVKTSSRVRQGSGQEGWGRERNFTFLIISQKKEMPVKSEKQQYYIKYIQRGFVQEERREAPAELGKDQED